MFVCSHQVKLPAIEAIVSLLPLFPTPLRPLAPSLHTLSIALICDPSGSQQLIDAGSSLFACLYLLAPKGRDGLREAWKTATEALTACIDSLVPAVTSDIFAEGECGAYSTAQWRSNLVDRSYSELHPLATRTPTAR